MVAAFALPLVPDAVAQNMVAPAQTAAYPSRPVRVVVPFAPGGTADILARALALRFTATFGQPFIVDNRPGMGGNLGAELVAKSAADGYTLLMGTVGTHAINPSVYARMPYSHVADFAPVLLAAAVPNVLEVNTSVPVHTVAELVAYAGANPGTLRFASSESGTSIHLSDEMLRTMTGMTMHHVAYRSAARALQGVLGGEAQVMFGDLPSSIELIRTAKLRPLAVTSAQRAPALPDIPTIAESGYPGFDASSWFGLLAPAGTPAALVATLNAEGNRWLASPEAKAALFALGANSAGGSPDDFARHIAAETAKWTAVVKHSSATD